MKLTIDDVLNMAHCYEDEQIVGLFDGREEVDALDAEGVIPDQDVVWLWLRCVPMDAMVEFARDCADRAKRHGNPAFVTHVSVAYAASNAAVAYAVANANAADAAYARRAERKHQINMLRGMLESTAS